ncbi:hypothetical protein [Nocardia callitridis]|uniref:Uncharacterized protein n=1 Tax=Nocardia callitridis TaxID=648753 RepID=A0ABP9KSK3_9NOCA
MSTDELDVRIRAGDGTTLPELTESLLAELLGGDDPFIELSRDDTHLISARTLPDGVYQLDHRAGAVTDQFQLYTPDRELVRDVLWSWLADDRWWHTGVAWFPVNPEVPELRAVHDEMSGLLDGLGVLDGLESSLGEIESSMDDALARADALLADNTEGEDA